MKVELENVKPMEIEKRSFEIITEELGDTPLIPGTELIVKRCIHTSADLTMQKISAFRMVPWKKQWKRSEMVRALSQIPRWQKRVLISGRLHVTVEKRTVLCQMRMWLLLRKKTGLQEPLPVWIKQQKWMRS